LVLLTFKVVKTLLLILLASLKFFLSSSCTLICHGFLVLEEVGLLSSSHVTSKSSQIASLILILSYFVSGWIISLDGHRATMLMLHRAPYFLRCKYAHCRIIIPLAFSLIIIPNKDISYRLLVEFYSDMIWHKHITHT
jgi:hypothetical protein